MKVRYASATGSPYGQFIIEAETELDRDLLYNFLYPSHHNLKEKEEFWLHGYVFKDSGYTSFNFGWIEKDKKKTVGGGDKKE